MHLARIKAALFAVSLITSAGQAQETSAADALRERVEAAVAQNPAIPGMAVFVRFGAAADSGLEDGAPGSASFGAAAGVADPDERAMTVDTPVRIASNTKTYTAAAYLRLWEQGRAALDASLRSIVDESFAQELADFGYDPDRITARHLLMHAGGLPDHADLSYVSLVSEDPTRAWTRAEQVARLGEMRGPLSAPGERFSYSDTGYVLLGRAVERATGQPLGVAVRELLRFDEIGLKTTWWELQEEPRGTVERAHQYLNGTDMHAVSATVDLYGGGGIACSVRDLAGFIGALFDGLVFDESSTLELMTSAPGHPQPEAYRIGLFPRRPANLDGFGHSGFWGTLVLHVPELDMTIAGVTLEQAGFRALSQVMQETIADRASLGAVAVPAGR